MVYYIVLGLILLYTATHKGINSSDRKRRNFLLFSFGLLILVSALRSSQVGIDLNAHYAKNFTAIAQMSWEKLKTQWDSFGYEVGFVYFCKIISCVSDSPQWFIVVTSLINGLVLARFIYRHSEDVVFSTAIVIFSCYYYMTMNIVRQMLAVSIILIAFDVLISDSNRIVRYVIFTLLTLLAATIHQSAIICLVFILFDILNFKRRHIIIAAVIVLVMYFQYDRVYSLIVTVMGDPERYVGYITSEREGVGGWSINSLINIVLTFGAFIYGYISLVAGGRQVNALERGGNAELSKTKGLYLYLTLFAGIFRLLVVRMNILNRVTFYFLPFVFIMYPLAVENGGKYRKIIKQGIYIGYFIYFTYMTFRWAQSYYGTLPYYFFWQ